MGMLVTTCNIVYILKVLMGMQLYMSDGRACACADTAFEKAHAQMKRIYIACNGKYMDNCWTESVAKRARWLTLTRILGSVWPIVSLLQPRKAYTKR